MAMAFRLRSHLLRAASAAVTTATTTTTTTTTTFTIHPSSLRSLLPSTPPYRPPSSPGISFIRLLSTTVRRRPPPKRVDIAARAKQLERRRLWTYVGAFTCAACFIIVVINNFQGNFNFYVTPTQALEKYYTDPSSNKYRIGGLVLENSISHPDSSSEMEFVMTDLETDVLVRFKGMVPDLFREGHSAVAEGFIKPLTDEIRAASENIASENARRMDCYFSAFEVLAKHDEKYVPKEIGTAIEANRQKIKEKEMAKEEEKCAAEQCKS